MAAHQECESRSARMPREAWERWAMDCRDPYFRRLMYPHHVPWYTPPRRGDIDSEPLDDWGGRNTLEEPHIIAMAERIAHWMSHLDVDDSRRARCVRARWRANTDETQASIAREWHCSRQEVGRLANEGQQWVEQKALDLT